MKFNCFPKRQEYFLIYSSYQVFRSRLFRNLVTQCSPKNSIFFRVLQTDIGYLVCSFGKLEQEVPNPNVEYVGIIKENTPILFEMDSGKPVYVWRKDKSFRWCKNSFLGYQLIEEYTLTEFNLKYSLIEKALKLHWNSLTERFTSVHGDFTHFNILYDRNGKIYFIDQKSHENSKLFDFFYFYAYLRQSVHRCKTLSAKDKKAITKNIELILQKVCQYKSHREFCDNFNQMKYYEIKGLHKESMEKYIADFSNLFGND